jgi:hypothetical protein
MSLPTHAFMFLMGTAVDAAGQYFALRFTDQRRSKESRAAAQRLFRDVEQLMPDLIGEMREDICKPEHATIRELVIYPCKEIAVPIGSPPRFAYYEDSHDNLRGKIAILEDKGFLVYAGGDEVPLYRVTDELVTMLRR